MDQEHHENEKVIAMETILQLFQVHSNTDSQKNFYKKTWDREVCDLNNRKPADLVRKLYQELPVGDENTIRGYKCPGHFSREPLRVIRRHFGQARLIVGLRHPVRWFERYVAKMHASRRDLYQSSLTLGVLLVCARPLS
jgi:hypothetical protein